MAELTATADGKSYGKQAFLIIGDPDKPSTWKVRVEETPGHVTVAQLGRAAAALTVGFRGQKVDASPEEIAAAKRKLRGLYAKLKAEPPDALKEVHQAGAGGTGPAPGAERLTEWTEAAFLGEAQLEEGGGAPVVRRVTLIAAGASRNRRNYPAAVLRRDGPGVFEGAPVYATNHNPAQKTLRELVGVLAGVHFEESSGRLRGDLQGFTADGGLLAKAVEASRLLGPERVGLSIDTAGKVRKAAAGLDGVEIEELIRVPETSVDLVMNPAAGGRLTESVSGSSGARKENEMLERVQTLTEALLKGMDGAAVRWLIEGLSEDEIRGANPDLAEAIIARSKETTTRDTATVGVTVPPPPAPVTAGSATLTEADVARLVAEQVKAVEARAMVAARIEAARDLPEAARAMLREQFAGRVVEAGEVDRRIIDYRNMLATQRGAINRVNVPGSGVDSVTEAFDLNRARLQLTVDQYTDRPSGMLFTNRTGEYKGIKIRPFTRISEMLFAFEPELRDAYQDSPDQGAMEALRHFQWGGGHCRRVSEAFDAGGAHLREAIITTSLDQAWADVLHRALQKAVTDPVLNNWRMIMSQIVPFADLTNTYKFVRVGEFGVLATVAEAGTYQEITAPADDQQAVSITKKGGLLTVSWESILRDDIGFMARIPVNFGRAWSWTVSDVVWGQFQLNAGAGQTMDADSLALYHASHNNIATLAFSDANLETVRQKLPKQTDPTSTKRKAYRARYLAYQSPDLDRAIWESLQSTYKVPATVTNAGEVNLPNFIRTYLGLEGLPVAQYPTATTTRWEVIADPADTETAVVGFLGGRETPDIFVQDMENVGTRFNADNITYKARGAVGCAIVNWRAFSRGNI